MLITHIVPRINFGGGTQSILAEVREHGRMGVSAQYRIVSLESNVATGLLHQLVKSRVRPYIAPAHDELKELCETSDIVVLHYWNTPSTYIFLKQIQNWCFRLVVYSRVNGMSTPQKLPHALANSCDLLILCNPGWAKTCDFQNYEYVPALVLIPESMEEECQIHRTKVRILHSGTLNFFKIHPNFVKLHSKLSSHHCQVNLYGSGGHEDIIKHEVERRGLSDTIRFRGFTPSMFPVFHSHDILSHPLHPLSYAASDKVLMEAMWTGLPVVLLGSHCMNHFVSHGETGWVADNAEDYQGYLELLVTDSTLRKKMGRAAKEIAKEEFNPKINAERLYGLYERISGFPKQTKLLPSWSTREFLSDIQGVDVARFDASTEVGNTYDEHFFQYACEGGYAHYVKEFGADLEEWEVI